MRRRKEVKKVAPRSSPPHDSLRPSSLVNYYFFYYRAGDWGRDGGDVVEWSRPLCIAEANRQLSDGRFYERIDHDPRISMW